MNITRRYLGWCLSDDGDGPSAAAARILLHDAPLAADGAADLATTLIVVSSGRVMRSLRYELLKQARAKNIPLLPPQMCTVESLASRALSGSVDQELVGSVDWLIALDQAFADLPPDAAKLLASRGLPSNPRSRFAAVRQLQSIIEHSVRANRAPREIAEIGLVIDSPSAQRRWESLQALVESAERALNSVGARKPLSALAWNRKMIAQAQASVSRVILVGLVEATPLTRAVINRLEMLGVSIDSWIIAPHDHAEGGECWFDELGCVRGDVLRSGPPLRDDQLEPADGPDDHCQAVVARYAAIAHHIAPGGADPGSIVIVNGDPELRSALGRAIESTGRSAHFGAGRNFQQTLAGKLLRSLAQVNASPHPDSLTALVAHPCVSVAAARAGAQFDLVVELDIAREESLVNDLEHLESLGAKRHDAKGGALMSQLRAIFGGFMPQNMRAPARQSWSELSNELARTIRHLLQGSIGDPTQEAACAAIDRVAVEIMSGVWSDTRTTADCVVAFFDGVLGEMDVPIAPDGFEVEVISWLDSLFDQSSSMVLMGIREGTIPSTPLPDGWLNEALRSELKLSDRSHRLARDAYVLRAIAARTKHLAIICGQTNAQGDPAIPSRLLFPSKGAEQARRVRRLLEVSAEARVRPESVANARASGFLNVPIPENYAHLPLPSKISVTDFKVYLESPYEFFLQKILRLQEVEPAELSLDPLQFGSIMHEAIARLADSQIKESSDALEIKRYLESWLRVACATRYGTHPKAGVILQIEIAVERLAPLVDWHLAERANGWILQDSEWSFPSDTQIIVDQVPQEIRGRVDRIDFNPTTGEWRIIDFKTGDKDVDPGKATMDANGQFIDLQLPLYRALAPEHFPGMRGATPQVGYVSISATGEKYKFAELFLSSEQQTQAIESAHDVIRGIRSRAFGTPDSVDARVGRWQGLLRQGCFAVEEAENEREFGSDEGSRSDEVASA